MSDDGQGRMAFMCMRNRKYLALRRLEEDAALFLSITPFYWDVSTHGDKFRYVTCSSKLNVDLTYLPSIGLASRNCHKDYLKPISHSVSVTAWQACAPILRLIIRFYTFWQIPLNTGPKLNLSKLLPELGCL
jgi:hypothetical protein